MIQDIKNRLRTGAQKNSSPDDYQQMLELFHMPEGEYLVKNALMEELATEEQMEETGRPDFRKMFSALWKKIEKSKTQKKSVLPYLLPWAKIAAVLLIGLVLGVLGQSLFQAEKEPVYYAAFSPKGSVSQLVLPDSTIIYLNADSRVRYSTKASKGSAEVFLSGEAFFDVKKNRKETFVVHTPYYDVVVTGTQFNVKAYETDRRISTTLEEGSVSLRPTDGLQFAENVALLPGDQAVFDKESKEMSIQKVNTRLFTSWKDNKLTFINMDMQELIILLERKFGVDIEVKNKEILRLHFDGTIKNESIIEILEIIKKTLPIRYRIVGQKIEISNR